MSKSIENKINVSVIIKKAVNLILTENKGKKIKAILLFGSHADKTATKRSDIDICVLFKNEVTLRDATAFRIKVLGKLPPIVDLQVFNILPIKLKKSISDNHKILFKDKEFNEFNFNLINQKLFFENKRKMAALGV
jgi:predicted nucleotidyltransferase